MARKHDHAGNQQQPNRADDDRSLSESDRQMLKELQTLQAGQWEQVALELDNVGGDRERASVAPLSNNASSLSQHPVSESHLLRYFFFLQEKGIRSVSEEDWRVLMSSSQRETAGSAAMVALGTFGGLRLARWGVRQFYMRQSRSQQQQQLNKMLPNHKQTTSVVSSKTLHSQKKQFVILPLAKRRTAQGPKLTTKEQSFPEITLFMEKTQLRRIAWGFVEFFITYWLGTRAWGYFVARRQLQTTAENVLNSGAISPSVDAMREELRPVIYLLMCRNSNRDDAYGPSFETSMFTLMAEVTDVIRNCERRRAFQRDLLRSASSSAHQQQQQYTTIAATTCKEDAEHNLQGVAIPTQRIPTEYPFPQPSMNDIPDPEAKRRADLLRQCNPYRLVLTPPPRISSSTSSSTSQGSVSGHAAQAGNDSLEDSEVDKRRPHKPSDKESPIVEELLHSMDIMSVHATQGLVTDREEVSDGKGTTKPS